MSGSRYQIGFLTAVMVAVASIGPAPAARALDREELGQILKIMPPNGPAELYGNVVMRRASKKAGLQPVTFPHWVHRARYTCRVCHEELEFAMRSGASGISRDKCQTGKFCGACHDGKTAFSARDGQTKQCDRCHMKDGDQLTRKFKKFASALPSAPFGNKIDWSSARAQGMITPITALLPGRSSFSLPDSLKNPLTLGTTAPRSDVSFSHEEHMADLDCANCHPDIFNIKKKGTQLFSMEINIYGQFCGVCHMRVAFPMNDCRRCHPGMKNTDG